MAKAKVPTLEQVIIEYKAQLVTCKRLHMLRNKPAATRDITEIATAAKANVDANWRWRYIQYWHINKVEPGDDDEY